MSDCKCKDCSKRQVGCHSKCDDYKEFKNHLEDVKHRKVLEKFNRGEPMTEWELKKVLTRSRT